MKVSFLFYFSSFRVKIKTHLKEAYAWKPNTMTGFLEKFLTFVRDVMAKGEDVCYVFEWQPEWEGVCFTFDPDQTKGKIF